MVSLSEVGFTYPEIYSLLINVAVTLIRKKSTFLKGIHRLNFIVIVLVSEAIEVTSKTNWLAY